MDSALGWAGREGEDSLLSPQKSQINSALITVPGESEELAFHGGHAGHAGHRPAKAPPAGVQGWWHGPPRPGGRGF